MTAENCDKQDVRAPFDPAQDVAATIRAARNMRSDTEIPQDEVVEDCQ